MRVEKYNDLEIWKKAMDLCEKVYKLTGKYPKHEQYGLVSQIRRCSVSVPSNIAEGFVRRHGREFKQFLSIALSSLAEMETQLMISERLGYIVEAQKKELLEETDHLGRMITKLRQKIDV